MSVKISCWASYFTQKKSFFLARTWHAHAFPGILAFLLSQPSHGIVGNGGFSTRKKGEKATFTECHASKQQRTFKNVGRISKKVRRFSENVGEKKKNVGRFSRKLQRFFGPFRWRLWKQKVQNCCDARACEEGTDEKRKLYAVIASNDQPFVRQICQRWESMDLPTHAPQHKWRTTRSQIPRELASAFACSRIEKHRKTPNLTSAHSRIKHTITFYVTFSAIFLSLPSYPPIYY